jgi:hypothetical protein
VQLFLSPREVEIMALMFVLSLAAVLNLYVGKLNKAAARGINEFQSGCWHFGV